MRSRLSCFLGKRFVGNTQTGDMGNTQTRDIGNSQTGDMDNTQIGDMGNTFVCCTRRERPRGDKGFTPPGVRACYP